MAKKMFDLTKLNQAKEQLEQIILDLEGGKLTSTMEGLCDADQSMMGNLVREAVDDLEESVDSLKRILAYADTLQAKETELAPSKDPCGSTHTD